MTGRWRNLAHLTALALLLNAAACESSSPAAGGTTAPVTRGALAGLDLLLESSEGFDPLAGATVRLRFHSEELSLSAGCNILGGSFEVREGALVVPALGMTERGCAAEEHAQDEWLAEFISSRPRMKRDGDRLTLTGSEATLTFLDREIADPDQALAGAPWIIDTFIEGDGASNLPLTEDPTVTFRADGTLRIQSTCNASDGTYTVSDDKITLSDIAFTEKACSGAALFAEQKLQAVLGDGEVTFEIDAKRLTIERGDMGVSAFRASE